MTIATVATRGYGSFGSIADVVTRGYSIGQAASRSGGGDLGMTEEEYRAYLRQLKARRRKLEERRKRDQEALRQLLRQAMGLDVEPEAIEEALEAVKAIDVPAASEIETSPSASSLAATAAKLQAIEDKILSIEASLDRYEADRAEDDDEEIILFLIH